jgi:hypothetical protein
VPSLTGLSLDYVAVSALRSTQIVGRSGCGRVQLPMGLGPGGASSFLGSALGMKRSTLDLALRLRGYQVVLHWGSGVVGDLPLRDRSPLPHRVNAEHVVRLG